MLAPEDEERPDPTDLRTDVLWKIERAYAPHRPLPIREQKVPRRQVCQGRLRERQKGDKTEGEARSVASR